jgi:hypothetical protein
MMHRSKKAPAASDEEYFNKKRPVNLQVKKSRVYSADILGIAFVGSCSGINFAWSFPHSVQPGWSQHPAYPAGGCLSFSWRLRVRQSSRRLGWQSRHLASRRRCLSCEFHRTMPSTCAPFGLAMQIERVGAIWRMNLDRRTRDKPKSPPLRKTEKGRPPGNSNAKAVPPVLNQPTGRSQNCPVSGWPVYGKSAVGLRWN